MRNLAGKKIITGVITLMLTLGGVYGLSTLLDRQRPVQAEKADPEEHTGKKAELLSSLSGSAWNDANTVYLGDAIYGFDHRIETVLFIGTDDSGNEEASGMDYNGAMADFLLLLVIDHTDAKLGFLQIDRNTVTDVPMINWEGELAEYRKMQICTAHWYGSDPEQSAENTSDTVADFLGELDHIDRYYTLNMDQIETINDAVDGVEITITEDMTSVNSAFERGRTLTLTNKQAGEYIRARMNVGEGDNASRMERQRTYMNAYFKKVIQRLKADPDFATKLWATFKAAAVTDITGNDVSRIAESFRKYTNSGILKLEGETKEGQLLDDGAEHEEFYPEEESLLNAMTELFSLVQIDEDELEEEA